MSENKGIVLKILHYINLDGEVDDFETIHNSIEKEIIFKGTNLWILVFAIIVASVGLNMNSTAVIIGAMLISPLMGPINGMGYGIATYNFELFRKALNNFTFAVLASLVASTTYFAISPVSTAHSELLARTSPTIYDVLIAMFGGLAGIVAISSKQKGNVIPGVAIATALMPPLCTAGYGLATGQFYYFFGALYLFAINTVFIALASTIVSQLLKFPIRTILDKNQKTRVNQWISLVIAITLIPSIYFGYLLVQSEKFKENSFRFIENINIVNGNYLLKHEIEERTKTITLVYGGKSLNEADKVQIIERSQNFNLHEAKILIKEGFSFESSKTTTSELNKLKEENSKLSEELQKKNKLLEENAIEKKKGQEILAEISPLYPQIQSCSFINSVKYLKNDPIGKQVYIVQFTTNTKLSSSDKTKIREWLSIKLELKNFIVLFE
ncbi:MAG: DUF389 domain-containing protein [Saprospiraceae bacterium]|nr:DUF389 domain-containing protein [Saprospiraceae bacterium]